MSGYRNKTNRQLEIQFHKAIERYAELVWKEKEITKNIQYLKTQKASQSEINDKTRKLRDVFNARRNMSGICDHITREIDARKTDV